MSALIQFVLMPALLIGLAAWLPSLVSDTILDSREADDE